MERREQYDPEDLEQLLLEHPYDELLEEERAYVLRHLSGPEEYSAMRSLLLAMGDTAFREPPMEAAPQVRDQVMKAFRAQRSSRWTIMLNSIRAALVPSSTNDLWRPALALGSVALMVTAAVWMWRTSEDLASPTIVQLQEPAPPPAPPRPTDQAAAAESADLQLDQQVALSPIQMQQEARATSANAETAPALSGQVAVADFNEAYEAEAKEEVLARTQEPMDAERSKSLDASEVPASITSTSHMVDATDLATNQSRTNAGGSLYEVRTGTVTTKDAAKARVKREQDASTGPEALSPELFAMLRAAW